MIWLEENLILMTIMLKKMFNWSEVHLSEMTCYKIHTLDRPCDMIYYHGDKSILDYLGEIGLIFIYWHHFDVFFQFSRNFAEIIIISLSSIQMIKHCESMFPEDLPQERLQELGANPKGDGCAGRSWRLSWVTWRPEGRGRWSGPRPWQEPRSR